MPPALPFLLALAGTGYPLHGHSAGGGMEGRDVPGIPAERVAQAIALAFDEHMLRTRPTEPIVTGGEGEILAKAAELGAAHGCDPRYRIPRDHLPAAFGASEGSGLMYMVIAAYEGGQLRHRSRRG